MKTFASRFERQIEKELCDFFGVAPAERWSVSNDGGRSMCADTKCNSLASNEHQ